MSERKAVTVVNSKQTFSRLIFLLVLLGLAVQVHGQGTTGFEVLRLQTHPRGSALAGALVADAGHIESIYYNPAGLAVVSSKTAAAGYMNYVLDIGSGYLAYAQPDPQRGGVWSVGLSYINYGDFDGRSNTGENLPDFTASDLVLSASYALQPIDKLNVGASLKFAYSDIEEYTGSALALDLGGQYTLLPGRLGLGAGIYNVGWTTKAYVNTKDDLPLYYRLGLWGIPEGLPATLYFSMILYHEYADNYAFGDIFGADLFDFLGDFYFGLGAEFHPQDVLYLRIGYDTRGLDQKVGTTKDALAGICGGIGLDVGIVNMDYGLASYGELGIVQRFAISKAF